MATTKITVTVANHQLEEIRALVAAGAAPGVSAFVKHAIGVALSDAAGWREMLEDALRQTGGPLTKKERTWADALLSPHGPKRVPGKAKAA
jgi:Arc/MetJ-type ribon-helix-helix transcriptional regulator